MRRTILRSPPQQRLPCYRRLHGLNVLGGVPLITRQCMRVSPSGEKEPNRIELMLTIIENYQEFRLGNLKNSSEISVISSMALAFYEDSPT